ncbi:hypothetical protein HYX14_05875 [Candidatus Woesearchaeota archaeon]|nr:hypothetical protein [Candidatus Woesearchaeota archaeon]
MKLLPSLKQKKRYIVFSVLTDKAIAIDELRSTIEKALLQFLGQLGVAKASPLLVKEQFHADTIILKVNHTYVDEAKAALTLIKKIKNTSVLLRSIITSGTLKKAGTYL